jgi:tRNA nucleotidyltransferase (CCA-adding enzyme)
MDERAELRPPGAVLDIAGRLERAGYETWCVGGAVRDALLGIPNLDWDLATAATPAEMRRIFRRAAVPIGEEHGTMGILDDAGRMHEVTTFRRDVQTDGRHAVVAFGASLDEDLARRDFTINAIAFSPSRRTLHDPFGGREDLRRGVVRAVGDPDERLREDRLRALRAIRFAARFGFDIDPATWRAIAESAPHLGRLSAERVQQELVKTMEQVTRPAAAIRRWQESGALATLAPPLAALPPAHVAALDFVRRPDATAHPGRREARLLTRLALLFVHLDGRGAERALKALKFSNLQVRWIAALADRWQRLVEDVTRVVSARDPVPDVALRRCAAVTGRTRVAPLARLASAVWAGARATGGAGPAPERVRSIYRRLVRIAYRDPIEIGDLAVDGDDLRRAGIPAGPVLGKILHALLERVIADPSLNAPDTLLALAAEIYRELLRGGGTDQREQ